MKIRLFVVAACLTVIVSMFSITASAAETDVNISGRWLFNNVVAFADGFKFDGAGLYKPFAEGILYTCGGETCDGFALGNDFGKPTIAISTTTNNKYQNVYEVETGWVDEKYREIDFGQDGIVVPVAFYEYMESNAVWLDAPPPPSPMQNLMSGIGAVFTGAIGWTGVVAATVSSNPLLLLFSIISFVGLGVILFNRLTKK